MQSVYKVKLSLIGTVLDIALINR